MAYQELIKNFERIRDYMREFFVYGFKSRSGYTQKSRRSYDDERRRIESWLGDYMRFRQDPSGKAVYLTADSRAIPANPLYQAFRAKSFTPGDICFHFYVLDLLSDGQARSAPEIAREINERYLSDFPEEKALEESSLRKKLKEYVQLGLLREESRGHLRLYRRGEDEFSLATWQEALCFFSEADPLGVIGSFLLRRLPPPPRQLFGWKHHYFLHALDSQVLCALLEAMGEGRAVELRLRGNKLHRVYPHRIFISTQSGRQYLLCYHFGLKQPLFFRLDKLLKVRPGEAGDWEVYAAYCEKFRENLWGVSAGWEPELEHLEMVLEIRPEERFVLERLEREKRCGQIEAVDPTHFRFTAQVYDAMEMLPWIRSFLGRIMSLRCSDPLVTQRFYGDLEEMRQMYGGDGDAVS